MRSASSLGRSFAAVANTIVSCASADLRQELLRPFIEGAVSDVDLGRLLGLFASRGDVAVGEVSASLLHQRFGIRHLFRCRGSACARFPGFVFVERSIRDGRFCFRLLCHVPVARHLFADDTFAAVDLGQDLLRPFFERAVNNVDRRCLLRLFASILDVSVEEILASLLQQRFGGGLLLSGREAGRAWLHRSTLIGWLVESLLVVDLLNRRSRRSTGLGRPRDRAVEFLDSVGRR